MKNYYANIYYEVSTTFLGADSPTQFYFNNLEEAEKYLSQQKNGEVEKVLFLSDESPEYFYNGCYRAELIQDLGKYEFLYVK